MVLVGEPLWFWGGMVAMICTYTCFVMSIVLDVHYMWFKTMMVRLLGLPWPLLGASVWTTRL